MPQTRKATVVRWYKLVHLTRGGSDMGEFVTKVQVIGFYPTRTIAHKEARLLKLGGEIREHEVRSSYPENNYMISERLVVLDPDRKTLGRIISRHSAQLGRGRRIYTRKNSTL